MASDDVEQVEEGKTKMPYRDFLEERRRYVEARQRAQQRADHLITTGAAGALVISITFLDGIAENPAASTRPLLIAAWVALLVALGLNLSAHIVSQRAFDDAIADFDRMFASGTPSQLKPASARVSAVLAGVSAGAFVVGVALLAFFALLNVHFLE